MVLYHTHSTQMLRRQRDDKGNSSQRFSTTCASAQRLRHKAFALPNCRCGLLAAEFLAQRNEMRFCTGQRPVVG